jgi:hypothetical protein
VVVAPNDTDGVTSPPSCMSDSHRSTSRWLAAAYQSVTVATGELRLGPWCADDLVRATATSTTPTSTASATPARIRRRREGVGPAGGRESGHIGSTAVTSPWCRTSSA